MSICFRGRLQQIVKQLKKKIFLRDKKIAFCTGCGVCNRTSVCVQKDDMAEVLDQMVKADVIVLATPIYFYTMDGQLKTMIDRTVPRYTEIWCGRVECGRN